MGKIANLMRKYLDSVSPEQLQMDINEIKDLGLIGPTMEEFMSKNHELTSSFEYAQDPCDGACFTHEDKDLCYAA